MEITVVEKTKNKLVIKIKEAGHTLCNMITKELWNDPHTKVAGYTINHPLVDVPQITIETDSKEDPKTALLEAVKRIKENNSKILKGIAKEFR